MGGTAVLRVGGATESELTFHKELAERTARALREGIRHGVVPGGGMAFLACQPILAEQTGTDEERAAFRMLGRALEAPLRTILANAGFEPSDCLAQVRAAGAGCAFDVRSAKVVNVVEAGILDVVTVLQAALRTAVTTAALALTTEVLVHRRQPKPLAESKPARSG